MPKERLTLAWWCSNAAAACRSRSRERRDDLVSLEPGPAAHPIMGQERGEAGITQEEGQDVEAYLAGPGPCDDDLSRRRAGEILDRFGDDLLAERGQSRVGIAESLVAYDRGQHPEAVVPRRIMI